METDFVATCRRVHADEMSKRRASIEDLITKSNALGFTARAETIHGTHWVDFVDEEGRSVGRAAISEAEAAKLH